MEKSMKMQPSPSGDNKQRRHGPVAIGQLLNQMQLGRQNLPATSSTNLPTPDPLSPTSRAIAELHEQFGTEGDNLLATFNPSMQIQVAANPDLAFESNAPVLAIVAEGYDKPVAESWLEVQIHNLSEFVGAREKLTPKKTSELAKMIILRYGQFRLTEFMLFFYRVKGGYYEEFYGVVDPLKIMKWLAIFAEERNVEIDRRRREKEWQKIREDALRKAAIIERYKARVPGADTPDALMTREQYFMLEYDKMDDEPFNAELAKIARGEIVLPTEMAELSALRKKLGLAAANE